MAEHYEITGKTFVITGGASGMGALFAENLLKEGAKGIAILDVDVKAGKATTNKLNSTYGNKVVFIKCDLSIEDDIKEGFDKSLAALKQIHVIINNAAIMVDHPDMWRTACNVNYLGLVSLTMKGLKHMRKDQGGAGGTIINISSQAAFEKLRPVPIYAGLKSGIIHFGQSLSKDPFFEQTGVRVLTMLPGPTATALLQNCETRGYDDIVSKEFAEMANSPGFQQKPESGAKALVKMFKEGKNGSIWLSVKDRPGKDITYVLDKYYEEVTNLYS